eukprot:1045691-Prymnesium_polylepis.1
MDLQPELMRKTAEYYFDCKIRPAHKNLLTGVVKAEATTSKRSAITVPQQYRWHKVCLLQPPPPTACAMLSAL